MASHRSCRWPSRRWVTTDRDVYLRCADRDADAAIFTAAIDDLVARYPERLTVQRSFDVENGLPHPRYGGQVPRRFVRRRPLHLRSRGIHGRGRGGRHRPRHPVHRTFRRCDAGTRRRHHRTPAAADEVSGEITISSGARRSPSPGSRPARRRSEAARRGGLTRRSPARRATARPAWPISTRALRRCASTTHSRTTRSRTATP